MAKIKLSEKIGYALGDAAAGGITWKIMSIAFPLFFTNVFGLTFYDAAVLMLVARVIDVFIDPVIGIVIACVILFSTWELLSESVRMSIDAVPEQIDFDETKKLIESVPGVCGAHHIHIWPISTTETALTAHLAIREGCVPEEVVKAAKQALREAGINHATLETEREDAVCGDDHCC